MILQNHSIQNKPKTWEREGSHMSILSALHDTTGNFANDNRAPPPHFNQSLTLPLIPELLPFFFLICQHKLKGHSLYLRRHQTIGEGQGCSRPLLPVRLFLSRRDRDIQVARCKPRQRPARGRRGRWSKESREFCPVESLLQTFLSLSATPGIRWPPWLGSPRASIESHAAAAGAVRTRLSTSRE